MSIFNYKWYLKDGYPAKGIPHHKSKVFTTFACGGGSSMGYKLAGYDVIGANDIDPQMAKVYKANHNPKHYFLCPIGDLLKMDLPTELYDLDILDGSPPCSTFSMAGSREKAWKKKKVFREGQTKQVLSDLFFDYIALVEKLRPKVFVAENVKGMLLGNAQAYTKKVLKAFDDAGYDTQLFLLNSATMGVPQKRERVFFIGHKKEFNLPKLNLNFNYKPTVFREIEEHNETPQHKIANCDLIYWEKCPRGKSISYVHPKGNRFNSIKLDPNKVVNTIASGSELYHYKYKRALNDSELQKIGTFPMDYNFQDVKPQYLIGMSVPPVMTAQIAYQIYLQWLSKINNRITIEREVEA